MNGINRLSSTVIDYAERMSAMADAAQGRQQPQRKVMRRLLLPVTGAAVYALVRSDTFSRSAKGVVDEAKTKASELPEDLIARVRETSKPTSSSRNGNSKSSSSSSSSVGTTKRRRASTARPRSTSSRRKTTASR